MQLLTTVLLSQLVILCIDVDTRSMLSEVKEVFISKKKRIHPDAPRAPCASGGPGAENVNSRSGCAVFYWVLVDRGPCRPDAPDATKDSEGTRRRKVLRTQPDRIEH